MSWPKSVAFTSETGRSRGRIGGKIAAQRTRQRSIALWASRFPGVPVHVIRTIYKQGYNSGWNRGKVHCKALYETRAFDAGYRQAQLDAMRKKSA